MTMEDATLTKYICFILKCYNIGTLLLFIIFQTHTAISKVIEIIETTEKVSFPVAKLPGWQGVAAATP